MTFFLIAGALFCGWAFLSLIGSERTRRLREIDRENRNAPAPLPPPAAAAMAKQAPASPASRR